MTTATPDDLHRAALAAQQAQAVLSDAIRHGDCDDVLAAREMVILTAHELAALRHDGRQP